MKLKSAPLTQRENDHGVNKLHFANFVHFDGDSSFACNNKTGDSYKMDTK